MTGVSFDSSSSIQHRWSFTVRYGYGISVEPVLRFLLHSLPKTKHVPAMVSADAGVTTTFVQRGCYNQQPPPWKKALKNTFSPVERMTIRNPNYIFLHFGWKKVMRRGDVNRWCIFCESFEGVFASPLLTYRMDPAKEGSLTALRSLPTRDVDSISPAGDDKAVLQDEPAGSHTFSPPSSPIWRKMCSFHRKVFFSKRPPNGKSVQILVKGNQICCSLVCCCQDWNVGHLFCAQTGSILARVIASVCSLH